MTGEGIDTEHVTETIRRARQQVEAVATGDGRYAVACTETGVSPDPVTGRTFETFATAELACLAARRYRSALGRLDPWLAEYDEWLRVENGPVVHFSGPDSLLDDEVVARQLDSSL